MTQKTSCLCDTCEKEIYSLVFLDHLVLDAPHPNAAMMIGLGDGPMRIKYDFDSWECLIKFAEKQIELKQKRSVIHPGG